MSRYFPTQIPNNNEVFEKEEDCINPFKCRKIAIPKYENINDTLNSHSIVEENQSQCLKDSTVTEIDTNTLCKKISNTNQKAFSWKNYSDNVTITTNEKCEEKIISNNSQDRSILINNDIKVII